MRCAGFSFRRLPLSPLLSFIFFFQLIIDSPLRHINIID
jgi:hypothetical protein